MRSSTLFLGFILLTGAFIHACRPDKEGCKCDLYSYQCCDRLKSFGVVCGNATFSHEDQALTFTLLRNDQEMSKDTLSVDELQGQHCKKLSGTRVCVVFSERKLEGRLLHLCVDIEVTVASKIIHTSHFCFTVGEN
ncbi:Hypothetical predicted protein [Cloeon dipterum]|uniref:DUF4773 domain-containing protein n=1 Tax=Cloeon dipterum TaxID=197152 RepID=A0A8S1D6F0_9INSE|nr:Hypothetical predicted protein [Cloeon dipterum]